ncbi:hypothetical protein B296_00042028 [Ensete ventricosum]|uniref:Uncharacterized protein n=1 Tax=Ensete ventricosum TaxID=4639 RepID=A0A426ZJW7_ENSVE|nr:hypothetical protein B296_00042028 [Ensete ventricosum]
MPVNSLRHFSFPKLRTLLPVRPLRKIMSVSTGSGAAGATDPTDPGTAFKLLLSCPSGLPASRIWSQRIQQNPSLYNGIKFRDICGHKPESSMGEVSCSFNRKFPWKCLMVSFVRWLKKLVFLQARWSTLIVTRLTCVQTDPLFIGISRRVMNVRPTAFFFLKCNLEAKEVCKLYSSAQDGYESTQIFTVLRYLILTIYEKYQGDLKQMAVKMPGCHRGGYALYKLMMEAAKDS